MQNLQEVINQAVIAAYGSASHPNYAFVGKVFRARPYEKIINEIKTQFDLHDITEINYDVSFSYIIKCKGEYLLQLSMVAKFCILFEMGVNREILQVVNHSSGHDLEAVLQKLETNDFLLVDEKIMTLSTNLINTESGHHLTVYQALFSTG